MSAEVSANGHKPGALGVDGLVKQFGGNHAVDGVSFDLRPGTIHALLGGNGSGKSTTIKILSGVYRADEGTIAVGGERADARSWTPADAKDAGLRFVHQDSSTFAELTVAENLAIGHGFETGPSGLVRWRAQHRRARALLDRFGLDIDPGLDLAQCGVATQSMVAIARALQDLELGESGERTGILVLDEPTAALPPKEVALLLAELRRFASEGQTILYVTHRLEEVVEIADRATVLRDGRVAGTLERSEIDHGSLVSMITGSKAAAAMPTRPAHSGGESRLQCRDLAGGAVHGASFELCAGEIVAVAGLLGSGRSTLLRMIAGDESRESGEILFDGAEVSFRDPRDAAKAGVAYSPEDRRTSAAFLDMSVRENIGMASADQYFRHGYLNHRAEIADAWRLLDTYQVRAASTEMPLSGLSGGNQQKALLVRWFRLRPRVLLLDEPTQGVDVGARAEIWQLVRRAVDEGAAALVVLSDFEELVSMCDRAIVMSRGRTVTEVDCDDLSESKLESLVLSTEGTTTA